MVTLAVLPLAARPSSAQTVLTAADSNVGAAGPPRSGGSGVGTFVGNGGGEGYSARFGNSLVVNGPTLVGGAGGLYTATDPLANYLGGSGGDGLLLYLTTTTTINSGSFTGGIGGLATGVGKSLSGGFGGSGLNVLASAANISGGTFQGGDSGSAAGTGTLSSDFAGSGLILDASSTVNAYGGSFTGGNGAVVPDGSNGISGDGLFDGGGMLNVYGGSFTGGRGGFGLDVLTGNTTLYGSGFLVNGVAVSKGPVTGMGTITGFFQDNMAPTTFTYRVLSGTLNISAPVPEASTTVSFGLLLALGMGGLIIAAKRKKGRAAA